MGKSKIGSILWTIITIILAIVGFSGYASGDRYMEWFGIRLSETGFTVLILVFLAIDIMSIYSSFKGQKKQQQTQLENLSNFQARTDLEQLQVPCTVNVTRGSSMMGAVMSCPVYLNYIQVGVLKNGQTITFNTNLKENVLTINYDAGGSIKPFPFTAYPGGNLHIDFKYTGAKLSLREQQVNGNMSINQ